MTLDDLLRAARSEGVTMITLDRDMCGCWSKPRQHYFRAYDPDPAAALRQALTLAIDPTHDPEILI